MQTKTDTPALMITLAAACRELGVSTSTGARRSKQRQLPPGR
jgi:hypothetical protein